LVLLGPPSGQITEQKETPTVTDNPQVALDTLRTPIGKIATTVTAQGTGKLALLSFASDPLGTSDFDPRASAFFGVVSSDSVSSMTVTLCARDKVNYLRWWRGDSWLPIESTPTNELCRQIVADEKSYPSVKDLRSGMLAISYDRTRPTLQLTALTGPDGTQKYVSGSATTSPVVVRIGAADTSPGSQPKGIWYALDDSTCQPQTPATCTRLPWGSSLTISTPGMHKLYYFTVDWAGNEYKEVLTTNVQR
jgi:hypothetical protein